MSSLEATFAFLVVQVTLFSILAAAAYLMTARRRPVIARRILRTAVLLLLGLTATAGLPLPKSWSVATWSDRSLDVPGVETAQHSQPFGQEAWTVVPGAVWGRIVGAISVDGQPVDRSALPRRETTSGKFRWISLLKLLLLVGGIIAAARLIRGLWTTHRVLGRGSPLGDARFTAMVEEIRRKVGCRPVTLRESDEISGAATIGWRRPILVVGTQWRQWNESEQLAVVAHEMMHIRSGDYLAGLLTRLATTLYFYHPMVRWLGTRFLAAQEMAADAAAAEFIGSRKDYVAALSRVALRLDHRIGSVPVLGFASPSTTFLMRRIEMLQTKDGRNSRQSRITQGVALGCLCFGAVAVSALRAPAEESAGDSASPVLTARRETVRTDFAETRITAETRPAIDLRYVGGSHGFIALRPATFFGRPEVAAMTRRIDESFRLGLSQLNPSADLSFSYADLEQVVGPVVLKTFPDAPAEESYATMFTVCMLRTAEPNVWEELLMAVAPGTQTSTREGAKVLETPDVLLPAAGPVTTYVLPDSRTITPLFPSDSDIPNWANRKNPLETAPWADDWMAVQECTVACLMDNTSGQWAGIDREKTDASLLANPEKCTAEDYWMCLAVNAEYAAYGIDWRGDSLELIARVKMPSARIARDVETGLPGLLAGLRAEIDGGESASDSYAASLLGLSIELLDRIEAKRLGSSIHVTASAKLDSALVEGWLVSMLPPTSDE